MVFGARPKPDDRRLRAQQLPRTGLVDHSTGGRHDGGLASCENRAHGVLFESPVVPLSVELEQLVQGLWSRADALLLMELFPSSKVVRLLPTLKKLTSVKAARPFVVLSDLFAQAADDAAEAQTQIETAAAQLGRLGQIAG